jgi:predicted dinucleotide-binding enzyme
MKIGVIGSGIVGRVLASAFWKEGHEVMLGSRDTSKHEVEKWKEDNPGGKTGTFKEAAAFGELDVLAVAGTAVDNAIELTGKESLKNKILIDVTNPIASAPPVNGVLKFFTTLDESLMERIQARLPDTKVVKAFNIVGNSLMYKPNLPGGKPSMFICGNDHSAKATVTNILTSFGWETEDMGKVEAARAIEPLCILWCIPGFLRNQWMHAFKLLKA